MNTRGSDQGRSHRTQDITNTGVQHGGKSSGTFYSKLIVYSVLCLSHGRLEDRDCVLHEASAILLYPCARTDYEY